MWYYLCEIFNILMETEGTLMIAGYGWERGVGVTLSGYGVM